MDRGAGGVARPNRMSCVVNLMEIIGLGETGMVGEAPQHTSYPVLSFQTSALPPQSSFL